MAESMSRDLPTTEAKIELNLSRLSQLFNSLDPSPFRERDLDLDAEEYIVGSAEEIPRQHPLRLVIHLPADQLPDAGAPDLNEPIHHYFAYRETNERRRLRLLFRDGRIVFVAGILFLFACMLLRGLLRTVSKGAVLEILDEGLLIIGWVAIWRPLEIFLYDWIPISRWCRVFAKLSSMQVVVQSK
jgi:hypothetical protein